MRFRFSWRRLAVGLTVLTSAVAVACGSTATPTPAPTVPPTTAGTRAPEQPTNTAVPTGTRLVAPTATPVPTVGPTNTPAPTGIVSARDTLRLVIDSEPITMNPIGTTGGASGSVNKDNLVDPFTWQSGDDLRIVPTSGITAWEQMEPNRWRFTLRQGVTFHNGEKWNAHAAKPTFDFAGTGATPNASFGYTGGIKPEVVDDYTLDVVCEATCPILPNTSIFLSPVAPEWFSSASESDRERQGIGFGPYKLVEWNAGVSVTQEAFEDYVPADHYEFTKPFIKTLIWQWRGEGTVAAAMVRTREADIAWDIGVDNAKSLPADMVRSGGSAEIYVLRPNALWHPELKKREVRQAIMHAINCEEIVETLFANSTKCRGNIIWPGVIGASEENTAPYTYDPERAKQLLQQAGYNPANKITMTGRGTRIPKQVEVYEAIQGYLQAVGMDVGINVVETGTWGTLRVCGIGKAVNDVLIASGRTPGKDKPTREDFIAAKAKDGASCPLGDMMDDAPSNETLDFGRQANRYMTCVDPRSTFCDPSEGGVEDQIPVALAASGEERQRLLEHLADIHREEVVHFSLFEMPVVYAVDPKLEWTPRFDRRIRANGMWFKP